MAFEMPLALIADKMAYSKVSYMNHIIYVCLNLKVLSVVSSMRWNFLPSPQSCRRASRSLAEILAWRKRAEKFSPGLSDKSAMLRRLE